MSDTPMTPGATASTSTPRAPMVALAAACVALAGLSALDAHLITVVHRLPVDWRDIVPATAPRWLMLSAVLPMLFHIAWKRPPWPVTAPRVLLHVALFTLLVALYASVQSVFVIHAAHTLDGGGVGVPISVTPPVIRTLSSGIPTSAFMYGVILLLAWGIAQARERHARELRAAQLESQLQSARLGALRAQLHPHFLYNTLNGIAAVVSDGEPQRAVNAIEQLAELLHAAFREDGREMVPLHEELALAGRYLALQQLRFGDRLQYAFNVADAARDFTVPVLILQPAVENAVLHGMAGRREPLTITVTATARGTGILLTVENDGAPLAANAASSAGGVGLANTRARLVATYGPDASLSVTPRAGTGVIVSFVIPRPGASARHSADARAHDTPAA